MLDYHRTLLADSARIEAYARAIRRVVRPGDVVLDLGSGTGILAFLACGAGAGRVYAVEREAIVEVARRAAAANGLSDRITFVAGDSREVDLPERADVLITETMGSLALDEDLLGHLPDARVRLLAPSGRIVPERIRLLAAPVSAPTTWGRHVGGWRAAHHGFDLSAGASMAAGRWYLMENDPFEVLAPPELVLTIETDAVERRSLQGGARSVLTRGGRLHGLGVWMEVDLGAGVVVSSGPEREVSTWVPVLFPLVSPLDAVRGRGVELSLEAIPWGDCVQWIWEIALDERAGEERTSAQGSTVFAEPDGVDV